MKKCRVCKKTKPMVVVQTSSIIGGTQQKFLYCIICGTLYVGIKPSKLDVSDVSNIETFIENGLLYMTYKNAMATQYLEKEEKELKNLKLKEYFSNEI